MNTHTYTAIPEKCTIPASEWKKVAEESVAKQGVKWINPRYVGNNPEFPVKPINQDITNEPRPKRREVAHVWYVDYKCHRSGSFRDKVAEGSRVRGGSTGKTRPLQKIYIQFL